MHATRRKVETSKRRFVLHEGTPCLRTRTRRSRDRTLIDDRQPWSHHAAPSGRLRPACWIAAERPRSPFVAVSHWKRPAGLTGPGLLTYPNVPKVPKGRHDLGSTRSCTASGQVGRGSRLTGRNDPVPVTSRLAASFFVLSEATRGAGEKRLQTALQVAPRRKLVWSGFKTLYSVPKLHSSCNTSHHTPRSCGARFFLLQRRSTCPRIASS